MKTNKNSGILYRLKRNKYIIFTAVILCYTLMMCSMTAYAAEPEEVITGDDLEIDLTKPYDPEAPPDSKLTPPGNLTLVDDLITGQSEDNQPESKQFITVVTKNGNYFYIIIDRTGDTENVYFLNFVDEYDLLAILEGEEMVNPPVTEIPADEIPGQTTQTPQTSTDPSDNNMIMVLVIVLLIAAGGGAFYYFKVFKPKKGKKKKTVKSELDEFDFNADEDLYNNSFDEQDGADYDEDYTESEDE